MPELYLISEGAVLLQKLLGRYPASSQQNTQQESISAKAAMHQISIICKAVQKTPTQTIVSRYCFEKSMCHVVNSHNKRETNTFCRYCLSGSLASLLASVGA